MQPANRQEARETTRDRDLCESDDDEFLDPVGGETFAADLRG